jgi:hypothetical protein
MNIDKRNHKRLRTHELIVKYKIEGQTVVHKADIIDISAGGICFLRSAYLEIGDVLQLKFPFESKKIVLTAKVIRVDGREAGVKFLDSDDQVEKFIKIFNLEYPKLKKEDYRNKEDFYKKGLNPSEEEDDKAEAIEDWLEIDKI